MLLAAVLPGASARAQMAAPAAAKAYIVADDKSGHILLAHNSNEKLQVASLTKVASALVVLDWARIGNRPLDTTVRIPGAVLAANQANAIGFQEGDEISMRDLLYAMLLQSDAIATDTLAAFVGRELPAVEGEAKTGRSFSVRFVAQMNALARNLKMVRTRFLNPVGSDGQEQPYSTAADMARLARHALSKPDFRFIVTQKERRITLMRDGVASSYLLRNTNELLGVKDVDGVKTGQTTRAGQCLIVSATRKPLVLREGEKSFITPRRLIIVVLGSADRFREASGLIDRGTPLYDQWLASGHPMEQEKTL